MDVGTHLQIAQAVISAGAGILGVGVGLGIFKNDVRHLKNEIKKVKLRQANLRGEDNGGFPKYITRDTCREMRKHCNDDRLKNTECVMEELNGHSGSIKGLSNFARWWMQKEGLTIHEINDILRG